MAKRQKSNETTLRIIGGDWRGRTIKYSGDARTRPMKERTREAIFNLLGPAIKGKVALDLFAGTGALALEALSRGAERAICIERHFPSARTVTENAALLGAGARVEIEPTDAFLWTRRTLPERRDQLATIPWVAFISPPYAFYSERSDEMKSLIGTVCDLAPTGSLVVVEADNTLVPAEQLPNSDQWDLRWYRPAQVGVLEVV